MEVLVISNLDLIIIVLLVIWNIIVFAIYGIDKRRSKRDEFRIKERTLILCAFLFGGLGALLGMVFFHHKTKKIKFRILVPLALVLNIVLFVHLPFAVTNFITK